MSIREIFSADGIRPTIGRVRAGNGIVLPYQIAEGQGGGGGNGIGYFRVGDRSGSTPGAMRSPNWPSAYNSAGAPTYIGGSRGASVWGTAYSFWMRFNETSLDYTAAGQANYYPFVNVYALSMNATLFGMTFRRVSGNQASTNVTVWYNGGGNTWTGSSLPLMFPGGSGMSDQWIWVCGAFCCGSSATTITRLYMRDEGSGATSLSTGASGALGPLDSNLYQQRLSISCGNGPEDTTLPLDNKSPIDICQVRAWVNDTGYSLNGPFDGGSTFLSSEQFKKQIDPATEASMLDSNWRLLGAWPLATDGSELTGADARQNLYVAAVSGNEFLSSDGPALIG